VQFLKIGAALFKIIPMSYFDKKTEEYINELYKYIHSDVKFDTNSSSAKIYNDIYNKIKSYMDENGIDRLNYLSDYEKYDIVKGYLVLLINDIKVVIKLKSDVTMIENPKNYCIVKENNVQYVRKCSSLEYKLNIIHDYKKIVDEMAAPKYKVGDRIVFKTMKGSYVIKAITSRLVTVTCKKWTQEGRPDMVRAVTDIDSHFVFKPSSSIDLLPF